LWNCKDNTCVAGSVDDMYFGPGECHTVAKHAGVAVCEFKTTTARTLEVKDLDQCNAGLAPKTSVATAHYRFFLACFESPPLGGPFGGRPLSFRGRAGRIDLIPRPG